MHKSEYEMKDGIDYAEDRVGVLRLRGWHIEKIDPQWCDVDSPTNMLLQALFGDRFEQLDAYTRNAGYGDVWFFGGIGYANGHHHLPPPGGIVGAVDLAAYVGPERSGPWPMVRIAVRARPEKSVP